MATISTVPVQRFAPYPGLQRGIPFQALPGQAVQAVPVGQFVNGRRVAVQAVQVPTVQRAVFAPQVAAVPMQAVQAYQPVPRPVAAVPMQRAVVAQQVAAVPVQPVQPVQPVPRALPVPVGYAAVPQMIPQVAIPQMAAVPIQPVAQASNALVVSNAQNVGSWWGEDTYGYGYGYGYTGYGYPAASAVPYAAAAPFAAAVPVAGYAPAAAAAAAAANEEAYAPSVIAPTAVPTFANAYFNGYNQGILTNGYAAAGYPVSAAYGGFFPGYGAVPFPAGGFRQAVPVMATGATMTRQALVNIVA